MPSLRTSRTALTHAVLTAIHPAVVDNSPFPFPLHLPPELHLLIRTYLRVHIASALLDSLHASLTSALSALCDDCKSYYAHVFGPHVADWPVVRAGRGCRCTHIGLSSAPSPYSSKTACLDQDLAQRPPVGDREPPAYFLAHVQHTLTTYASMDPSFPYADRPIASATDLDVLVFRVLSTFGWTAIPSTSHRIWEFDNDISIVPSSPSHPGAVPAIAPDGLRLHLDLSIHDQILACSPLHPTKVTYFPPLPSSVAAAARYPLHPFSTGLVSATLFLLAVTSPLAIVYALHLSAHS